MHLEASAEKATILIVDDEELNRALLTGSLEGTYRVVEAPGGAEALEILKRVPVDLVLLDVMMPGLSGYDVCKKMKASQRARDAFLPVVLVTALGDQEARNKGLSAGADEFLTKPVDRRELLLRAASLVRLRAQDVTIRAQLAELRKLSALKDDFVSLIVHDLRNPLAGVTGCLQLTSMGIREQDPPADIMSNVDLALESAGKIESLLEEFLQVRLLEEGELTLFRIPYSVTALAQDAIRTVQGAARARHASIELEPSGERIVHMDVRLARRAVENLLSNALKYSPTGESITVSMRSHNGTCAIEIADRGPGVPDALKKTIFEKFKSVESSRGTERHGHGLGLHLVSLVAAAHGGEAAVRDREGGGSVFEFALPAQKQ